MGSEDRSQGTYGRRGHPGTARQHGIAEPPVPRAEEARGTGPASPGRAGAIASAAQRACPPAGLSELADPAAVAEIGYPVLVRAAYGGGGRGMRIVSDPAGLADATESAQREGESAFGNGTLFIERFIDNTRHVEVQILGDHEGTVTPLFERECSIQRVTRRSSKRRRRRR
jgi:acetyl/propionyl-CoA carboxylase alpha subunit